MADVPDFPLVGSYRPVRPCQYGIQGVSTCEARATTKRQRPNGDTWDVCERHAASLDRIERLVRENATVLERLRDA